MILVQCIYSKAEYFTEGNHYPVLEKFKDRMITINDKGKKTNVKYTGGSSKLYFDWPETNSAAELNMACVVKSWPIKCVTKHEVFCSAESGSCLECSNWNTLFNDITERNMEAARERMDNPDFPERIRLRAKGEFFAIKSLRDSIRAWEQ